MTHIRNLGKKFFVVGKKIPAIGGFLKKAFSTSFKNKIRLNSLPWYLLIGTSQSGKTTLIENSQITFNTKNHIAPESLAEMAALGTCKWWLTPDAALLDVPGSYLSDIHSNDTAWQNLFTKKVRAHPIAGVVVTLPLSELIAQEDRLSLVDNLKFRTAELKEKFGAGLPFYFAITKCDLLPGFLDFFAQSGTDELGQAWGITLPNLPANASLVNAFSNRFNALIQRLNKQLIWRLHQERGTVERVFIKDFPLHIERLKETIITILTELTASQTRFNLQGVYLTSASQHVSEENIFQHKPSTDKASTKEMQILYTPSMPSRSYFIRQFLLQGLHSQHANQQKIWQKRPVIYGLCASTIALTILFLGFDIFYSKQKLIAMQGAEVSSFNIIAPPDDVPKEIKIGDSLTSVS